MGLLTFPHTITPGTTASATEVQENFDAIKAILNGAVETANLADSAVSEGKLATSAVTADKIANGAVTLAKLGDKLGNSVIGRASSTTGVLGVLTASAGGVLRLVAGVLGFGKLASEHFEAGAVDTAAIADQAVTYAKLPELSDSAILGNVGEVGSEAAQPAEIAPASADTVLTYQGLADPGQKKLGFTQVRTNMLEDGAVTTAKIAAVQVTDAKLATGAVTTTKIVDANVTTAKIADAAITTAKLGSSSVDWGNIKTGAVINSRLADGAVSYDKLSSALVTRGSEYTYALLRNDSGGTVNGGTSIAGSGLSYVSFDSSGGPVGGGTAPSGTWRNMGHNVAPLGVSLFVRTG